MMQTDTEHVIIDYGACALHASWISLWTPIGNTCVQLIAFQRQQLLYNSTTMSGL